MFLNICQFQPYMFLNCLMFLNAHPLGTSFLYRVRKKDKGANMICPCRSTNISFSLTHGDETRNRMFTFFEGFNIRIRKRMIFKEEIFRLEKNILGNSLLQCQRIKDFGSIGFHQNYWSQRNWSESQYSRCELRFATDVEMPNMREEFFEFFVESRR